MNTTVVTKNTGDTLTAAEFNDVVQAVNSKADAGTFAALIGTTWNLNTQPLREITLSANTALTTTGTAGVSSGVLLVNNPSSFTLTINGTPQTIKNNGECAVTVIYKSSGIYYSSDAATGGATLMTLATPTLSAGTPGATSIPLTWTNVSNESSYELQRSTDNINWTGINNPAANATSYTATGLTTNTLYYFRIRAVGDGTTYGNSGYSTASATTTDVSYDADATAYFSAVTAAGGTLTTTQKSAWNDYVVSQKAAGLWAKKKFIYPMMGGTAASNAINAKTPGTYDVTWGGTLTHDAIGVKGSATGYGNTGFTASTALTDANSTHLAVYVIDNLAANNATNEIGFLNGTAAGWYIQVNRSSGSAGTNAVSGTTTIKAIGAVTESNGYYLLSRTSSTSLTNYKNGAANGTNATANTATLASMSLPVYLLAFNSTSGATQFSDRKIGFASGGEGFSSTDATDDNTHFQTFKTAVGK